MVPPLEFIGHAEEHGLIDLIGDWVIEHACAQAAAWRREGLDLGVGFNVAPRQLQSPGFVDRLAATVARHGADPRRLTVEITESAAMGDPATTEAVLRALDELGPLVAIDDFGAGHSSLGRLRELPVKGLKLDRSFLARVPEDDAASAIVGGVLALTESLGLHAIAEGIETEEQLAFLVERGCRWGQGFHLARPLPAAEVTELLRRSSVAVPR
jgi:EAL domain-containing protein (putative c-di-GMP-specific phosphodiesterase class I)